MRAALELVMAERYFLVCRSDSKTRLHFLSKQRHQSFEKIRDARKKTAEKHGLESLLRSSVEEEAALRHDELRSNLYVEISNSS